MGEWTITKTIPFDDYGGQGPYILFVHANGYVPASYRKLHSFLANNYRILAMHQRPLWPESLPENTSSWSELADDLILFLEQQGMNDVVTVGHSLGAVVAMIASLRRPQLFNSLVLIEPVFLIPEILQALTHEPPLFNLEEYPLIKSTRRRPSRFPDRQVAYNNFRQKRVFARWSDDALWDYVIYGLKERESGGFELIYDPVWEAHLYLLVPTNVWQLVPRITVPTLAIRGEDSDTILPAAWQLWREKQPRATFVEVPDSGHLVPMEKPETVAKEIDRFLQRI
jgi:pimeloyl-ACP methyl ester carboxylesterase